MASGFGLHNSNNYGSGFGSSGRAFAQGYITQTVDSVARTVTITLDVYLAYYRSGSTWPSPSGELGHRYGSPNWISGGIGSDTRDSGSNELGLTTNGKSLVQGHFYNAAGVSTTESDGAHVASYKASRLSSPLSKTYNYDNSGAAISVTWWGKVVYNGTTMEVGGTVVTDSISPVSSNTKLYGSVNGRAKKIGKLYGSVNGVAKKITKLYAGDENGIARLIYKE